MKIRILIPIIFCLAASLRAQTYSDPGIFSGSGLVMIPSTTVSPNAQFRINGARMSFLKADYQGVDFFQMSTGFSSNLEGYIKLYNEKGGGSIGSLSIGFGGKLRMPFSLPYISGLALWMESIRSENEAPGAYVRDGGRGGAVASFGSNEFSQSLILGYSNIGDPITVMIGGSAAIAPTRFTKLGVEFLHGVSGPGTDQMMLSGTHRIFSGISLHLSPGFVSGPGGSSWLITGGISVATADLDFLPVIEMKQEEFRLPTIEEIEKEAKEDKKE